MLWVAVVDSHYNFWSRECLECLPGPCNVYTIAPMKPIAVTVDSGLMISPTLVTVSPIASLYSQLICFMWRSQRMLWPCLSIIFTVQHNNDWYNIWGVKKAHNYIESAFCKTSLHSLRGACGALSSNKRKEVPASPRSRPIFLPYCFTEFKEHKSKLVITLASWLIQTLRGGRGTSSSKTNIIVFYTKHIPICIYKLFSSFSFSCMN